MSFDEQIQYHASRAARELDQGLDAKSTAARRAHMELSSLHLAKVQALRGSRQSA